MVVFHVHLCWISGKEKKIQETCIFETAWRSGPRPPYWIRTAGRGGSWQGGDGLGRCTHWRSVLPLRFRGISVTGPWETEAGPAAEPAAEEPPAGGPVRRQTGWPWFSSSTASPARPDAADWSVRGSMPKRTASLHAASHATSREHERHRGKRQGVRVQTAALKVTFIIINIFLLNICHEW